MKQYFFSYHIYKNGVMRSFGHGDVVVGDDITKACDDAISKIISTDCDIEKSDIHLLAFNRIN